VLETGLDQRSGMYPETASAFRRSDRPASERLAAPTTTGELMLDAKDVILKHIAAVNDR